MSDTRRKADAAPPDTEPLELLLEPAPRRTMRVDPFGNPLEILEIESRALPAGLASGKTTAQRVRVEVRRDPLDPSRIAFVAPHRGRRRGIAPVAPERKRSDVAISCGCPFEMDRLLASDETRLRIVPGQSLRLADNLGGAESFLTACTAVIGNASPGAPHLFLIVSTRDHHLPLHRRPACEVEELLSVFGVLTDRARRLGARGIEIIKNRGPFAGGTVEHPHWQARILKEGRRRRRSGVSVQALAQRELRLRHRVFFRRRLATGVVVGWRSFAGFESNLAVVRSKSKKGGPGRPPARWVCDVTRAERRALAAAMRVVSDHYEAAGIENYNAILEQPPLGRRPASGDVFRLVFVPRGPKYQPAGFEIASGYTATVVSESPEEQAALMRSGVASV